MARTIALALALAAGGMAGTAEAAGPRPFSGDWFAAKNATQSAGLPAGGANVSAVMTLAQQQQANPQLQRSFASFNQTAAAIAAQQAAQAAASQTALNAASSVPNGLTAGGLAQDSQPLTRSWLNAQNPTQSVASNGQVTVLVKQTAAKSILSWQSFNIGSRTQLNFDQSGGTQSNGTNNWVVLNRVNDPSAKPSQILGSINAQGSVYVLNRNGIIFGGSSQVNVFSLVASTLNLFSNDLATSNNRFINGGIGDLNTTNFTTDSVLLTSAAPGAGDISLAPGATITTGSQGLALLAAPNITTSAAITAPGGQIALVAGIGVSYDYNATSFVPGTGTQAQGINANNTTNLRFANYGKLEDAQGDDITPVGQLINNGLLYTPRGNITLLGGAIEQNGVAEATTSTAQPGSIVVSSQYEVGVSNSSKNPADEYDATFYTGAISFGPQAVTTILPDGNGVTLSSDTGSLAPFQTLPTEATFISPLPTQGPGLIEIIGQALDFKGGSLVYAPGQTLSATTAVLTDPRAGVPALPDAGRVLLESGAVLDVSGMPDVPLSVQDNLLTVRLSGNELADDPLQQDGPLYNMLVTVDMGDSSVNAETGESWVGTPLANLAGYQNLVQRSIDQLLVNGGAVYLGGNEVIGAAGSAINVTGGYLNYQGGWVKTTRLVNRDGALVSIGNADPNDMFVGIAGQYIQDHPRWGVTSTYDNPLIDRGMYVDSYLQGGNAGSINIGVSNNDNGSDLATVAGSGAAILQSTLLAGTVAGARQTAGGQLPSDGSFNFGSLLPIDIADPSQWSAALQAAANLPADFTASSPLLATADSDYTTNVLDSRMLNSAGFKDIALTTSDIAPITEDAGTSLAVQPGGSIALDGDSININGTLTARGGSIAITTAPNTVGMTNSVPGDITLGAGALLDVSGQFVNNLLLPPDQQTSAALIKGGSIALVTEANVSGGTDLTGNITLTDGSRLDLEGGGLIQPNGQLLRDSHGVPQGQGGNLTLATYQGIGTPVTVGAAPTRGVLTLDGDINALGFNGGGTLTLQAVALQIGGDKAATPAYGFYFDPIFWGNRGFAGFDLRSALQSEVPAGAQVRLTHANLLPDLNTIVNMPSGALPAASASAGYLTGTQLSPTNLSITAGLEQSSNASDTAGGSDYAQIDAGARIIADPGAAIALDSYAMVAIFGAIDAPGGAITLTHDYGSAIAGAGPIGPIYLGGQSVLDVAGVAVDDPLPALVPTAAGLVTPHTGEVLPGGTVTITDPYSAILAAPGAVIDVSGAAGVFDVPQLVGGGLLGRQQEVLTPRPAWSDAGTVSITGGTDLLFEGRLIGNPGAPQANGGTLQVTGVSNAGLDTAVILVQDPAAILTAAGSTFDFATYVPQAGLFGPASVQIPKISQMLLVGADTLQQSGFSSLELNASRVVGYAGQVSLSLDKSFSTSSPYLEAYAASLSNFATGVLSTQGASLSVSAPYISITGGGNTANGLPAPQLPATADATLALNADALDLSGFIYLQNIGQATFTSQGDLRLLPAPYAPLAGTQLFGYLLTEGNLTFKAADIYPATDTTFVIEALPPQATNPAPTTITFGYPDGVAPSTTTPLSAGGELVADASNIVQNGELQAPFGAIVLGVNNTTTTLAGILGSTLLTQFFEPTINAQSVTLGSGSITSVSANGMLIPYGSTVDQTTWVYNPQLNNPGWDSGAQQTAFTYPLTAAPQGVVTLSGTTVNVGASAVVDLDGGGGLYAQEWIPGTGGSRNVLLQYQTSYQNSVAGQQVPTYADQRSIYAIVPGFNGPLAPYDANLSQPGLGVGQAIYLNGGDGLAAGVYTLLPAQYATLPGAYRVVANSGVVNPLINGTLALPDGTLAVNGYLTNTLTGSRPSALQQFLVQPAATWQKYSQYALTGAAGFFPAYAAANGLAAPYVPADAGRLAIAAGNELELQGTVLGTPGQGGYGAQVDISGQYIKITDNDTGITTVVTGALAFNASGASATLGTGATVDLSGTLGASDTFTITGGSGSVDAVVGTLTIPIGSSANRIWTSSQGGQTFTNNSLVIGNGDSLKVSSGTIAVKTQDIDNVQLSGFNQGIALPASSATAIELPQASSTFTYSNGSGSGGNAITLSSPHPFSVGGANAPFNPATGLYTTNTYTAKQIVQGTAAGQVITLTTGGSGNAGLGAGGNVFPGTDTNLLNLGLAPALANSTVTYNLGNDGVTLTALSPADLVTGEFNLFGNAPTIVPYTPGSYAVTYDQVFGNFAGAAPVTFTASTLDQVAYSGADPTVSLPTTQAYLQLSAKQLDSLGATSLLIGGLRSLTSVGEVITPTANGIIVGNNAGTPLAAPEIMLVAAPQLAPATVTFDQDQYSDTTSISTPLAGTGQVVFDTGSVVEAQGAVGAGEPTKLYLGSTLANLPDLPDSWSVSEVEGFATSTPKTALTAYYAAIDAALGTLVRLSDGAPVNLVLPSVTQLTPGTISITDTVNPTHLLDLPSLAGFGGATIESGATLLGGNGLTAATTGDTRVQAGALLSGNNISLNSSQITFVGSGEPPASGAVVDPVTLVQLQNAATVDLQSGGTIAFQGNVDIAMGNGALTLGAGSLTSDGGHVSLDAGTLTLDNEMNAPAPAAIGGAGTLAINAGELIFGAGDKSLQGFGAVSIMASQGVVGQGTGSMDFGTLPVTLQTPALMAAASSTQTLTTTGALAIVPLAGGNASIPAALGGAIALQGGSVDVAVPIEALAGNISLAASAGDVTVLPGGQLIVRGAALPFHDRMEYAGAGNIRLSADQGAITIQPGALVDFSGAAGGGAGGSLAIATTGNTAPVVLDGTLLGTTAAGATGSNFSLNADGPVALDALAQLLTGAGVTGDITVESGTGDLVLNGMLAASQVTLTADAGAVTVNGAITADGTNTAVGEINLYGTTGVDIQGRLLATGSPNSQHPGGDISIGTSGTGSTTSLNATYGYENVDAAASGTLTLGPQAVIDASGGAITLRAPILDADNAQGLNVNVTIASGARINGGTVNLDAYAVWSTADQSANPKEHFDGYIDPAGWYDGNGNLVSGTFTNASGGTVLNYTAGSMTAAQLATYLTNDYFTPGSYDAAHAVFYGGYNPNSESFNPSAPDAGSLPAFIQHPGLRLGNTFAGIGHFQARPEVDLVNPSPARGGANSGNITVLTNWNLGAGVMNPDGSLTLAYRYQGAIAPVIALRAAGDVRVDASITDGFFQTAGVSLPTPASLQAQAQLSYAYTEQLYLQDSPGYDGLADINIMYVGNVTGPLIGAVDPNATLVAPQPGGSTLYYQNYLAYVNDWTQIWNEALSYDYGYFNPITAPTLAAPVAPSAADPAYVADYQSYLGTYGTWLQTNFTPSTIFSAGTPTAPVAPTDPTQYAAYITADQNYINYIGYSDFDPATFATPWSYAPVAPGLAAPTGSTPPLPIPAGANAPANMPTAANPSPVQFAALVNGQSASYAIVAGANLVSANPLAVAPAVQFAAGSASGLAGEGNVTLNDHTAYTIVNSYGIVAPTTIRTGAGSIDIAAPEDFELLDSLAPGVVYTAGVAVQPVSASNETTVALGGGAFRQNNDVGVSTILTPAVNAEGAGDLSLTIGGDILGMEDMIDTLATSPFLPSGLTSKIGAFIGQFWEPWLLENPATPNVPWYVNFGSFDQGLMSIGGNVSISAGGDIRDLAVSLPTTGHLDASNNLQVTGGGVLSVTTGGSIYSGDFYVGAGAGAINAGGAIAPDFSYVSTDDASHSYAVATLLAVQYGTIAVGARQSIDIGGVYDPTYLWAPGMGGGTQYPPIAAYNYTYNNSTTATPGLAAGLIPYFTSMGTASGVSVQTTAGSLTFNSAIAFGDMLGMGTNAGLNYPPYVGNTAAFVPSLLLPASLSLAALGGDLDIGYGGGLYPSATGTLSLVADQSIELGIPLLTSSPTSPNQSAYSSEPLFTYVGNVFGTTLEKLAYPVGTGILPTASEPALVPVWNLPASQTYDPALIADQAANPVYVDALNGSIVDGVQVTAADGGIRQWVNIGDGIGTTHNIGNLPVNVAVGGTVDQISLVPNAPAEVYAGLDILDLPFYGTNFSANDVTSLIAGRDIRYNIYGDQQSPAIELAGPGMLDVVAGRNLSFESQRIAGVTESGIRTLGNAIDTAADPILNTAAPTANSYPYSPLSYLGDFGNPYLPVGGAAVNVLFGVGPGMDQTAFVNQYINPVNAATVMPSSPALLTAFVAQYETAAGNGANAPQTADQAWAIFQQLPADQQQLLVEQVFFDVLNQTGINYNDAASPYYHQYSRGYQAINTLFPASLGYTPNALGGGSNGANQLVATGDFDMRGSTVQTQQGGNIAIMGPGGRILVGSSIASPAANPASEGILTLEQGDISIFTNTDVLVAQSRVMTEQGGGILMWSSNGNLDAGKGAKTSVSAPLPLYACDIDWVCSADIKGQVSGAGIATLQSLPGVPTGDANLIAPRGTVDAGAAGIRVSGNLNITALQVLNAANVEVAGKATGLPTVAPVNIGALTAASQAASSAVQAAQQISRQGQNSQPSIISVEILGYGNQSMASGGDSNGNELPAADTQAATPSQYDTTSYVQLIGHGRDLKPELLRYLTESERRQLQQDQ